MAVNSQVVLRWNAYEHEHIERGRDWFWALGVIALCAAVISVIFHDYLFALVIISAAFAFGVLAKHPPRESEFEISEKGISINGTVHRYREIIGFWVEEEHHEGRPLLLVDTTKFMAPNFIIPIEHIDPSVVRAYLLEHAKETPMREPTFHKIVEFFGL